MREFFNRIFSVLHLPSIGNTTLFGQIGFYAEVIFIISSFLLIINVLLKYFRREEFFSGWTTFLLIVIPTSLIIIAMIWVMFEKIDSGWEIIKPHF